MKRRKLKLPFFHSTNLLVSWFGSGFSPIVSGTAGSLATLPFAWAIRGGYGTCGLAVFAMAVFFIGWWASHRYLKLTGGGEDPGEIVIDETAGQSLLLCFMPYTWQGYVVGFVLFRLFDIVKPWPVSWADGQVPGALGIMLDDILAALYPPLLLGMALAAMYAAGMHTQIESILTWLRG